MTMHMMSVLAITTGLVLLLAAALHDVAARTVPNRLATAIAAAGLLAQALDGGLLYAIPAALAVFLVAALFWRRGWMGGGDVKLLAAAALLVPPVLVPSLIVAITLAGGLLAVPYLIARRRLKRPPDRRPAGLLSRAIRAERWRLRRGGRCPTPVAIAGGVYFILAQGVIP